MSDNCTIYCVEPNYEEAIHALCSVVSREKLKITGAPTKWSKIVITGTGSTLTINSMKRGKPGDSFSKLILSTNNYFRNLQRGEPKSKAALLSHVSSCNFILGIVASPSFNETGKHHDCIYSIARALNGVIFNGEGMIDADGNKII